MSSVRNRSQSHFSPQVNQHVLQHDLEGATEALAAFDGFESAGPVLHHRFASAKGASTAQPSAAVAETGPQPLCIRPLLAVMLVRDGDITSFQQKAD